MSGGWEEGGGGLVELEIGRCGEILRIGIRRHEGLAGLSLRAGGRGFSPATKRVAPFIGK